MNRRNMYRERNMIMMMMNAGGPMMNEAGQGPSEIYKANSGAIKFQVRFCTGTGFGNLSLSSRDCPEKDLYKITLGPHCRFLDVTKSSDEGRRFFRFPQPLNTEFIELWLTWYNSVIHMGLKGQIEPFFTYNAEQNTTYCIGYVKFCKMSTHGHNGVEWRFETASPVNFREGIIYKDFDNGKLRWVEINVGDQLPPDALIGGFEDEPLYIARSRHNGSLCPGKYVPSKRMAFIPWGGREFAKNRFEILCGYNAWWIKTKSNYIPPNAFIAGNSEVRQEPLYIGRAMHDYNMINGKVHVLYATCYLPYQGKEVEVYSYEILVSGDMRPRGILPEQ